MSIGRSPEAPGGPAPLAALLARARTHPRELPALARRIAAEAPARRRRARAPGEAEASDALVALLEKAARRAKTEDELSDLLAGLAALFGRPELGRVLLRGDARSGAELFCACPRCGGTVAFREEGGHFLLENELSEDEDESEAALAWLADAAALAEHDADPVLWLPQIAAQAEYFRLARRLLQLLGKARCPACGRRFVLYKAARVGSRLAPEPLA